MAISLGLKYVLMKMKVGLVISSESQQLQITKVNLLLDMPTVI